MGLVAFPHGRKQMSDTRATKVAKEINEFANALQDPDGGLSRHIVTEYARQAIKEAFAGEAIIGTLTYGEVQP